MVEENKFNYQIVAFIDILGFSEMVKEAQNDSLKAQRIIDKITNAMEEAVNRNLSMVTFERQAERKNPTYRVFSDCICISSDCLENTNKEQIGNDIFMFLMMLMYIQADFLQHDVLIRGGATINKHFSNNEIIFSAALVEAYELESKKAIYPRILIQEKILENLKNTTHESNLPILNSIIKKDSDGLFFLDYLEYIAELSHDFEKYDFMEMHHRIIENMLKKSHLHPSIKQKYLWMAGYHNQKVREKFNNREDRRCLLVDNEFIKYDSSVFPTE